MPGSKRVHVTLTLEGASLEAAVDLAAGRVSRRVLLPVLRQLTDTLVQMAENSSLAAGQKVSCRKGCDACCRQMVPISPTEAHGLAETLDAMPPTHAVRMLTRFDAALEALDSAGLLERLMRRHALHADQLKQLDRDYFSAQIPCPFLENHACAIHEQRPLACREFLVTSPARHCQNPGSGHVHQVPLPAKVSLALASQDQTGWLPLVLARHFVARNPERKVASAPAALQKILKKL